MAGDPTKNNITQEEYQKIVNEEFVGMLRETYGDEILEEGFWDKLKGGGKKIGKAYMGIFKAYGEVMADLMGIEPDDPKAPDVPAPEEVAQDLASGETEEVADGIEDMGDSLEKMKGQAAKEDPDIAKKVEDLIAQVQQMNQAVDKGAAGEGGESAGKKTEDSEPLLNILDAVIDEWDAIQGKTKDKSLKKAMDYIEKIALAEIRRQKGLRKLKEIREKRKNG